jgi:hypothetical protein
MAKVYGIQFSSDESGIAQIVLTDDWRRFCARVADDMKFFAENDQYPEGSATAARGIQPPGLYRENYVASAELYRDHYHAVLANTEREAIWIETGTHPGGGSTWIPGHHVMERAMVSAGALI